MVKVFYYVPNNCTREDTYLYLLVGSELNWLSKETGLETVSGAFKIEAWVEVFFVRVLPLILSLSVIGSFRSGLAMDPTFPI